MNTRHIHQRLLLGRMKNLGFDLLQRGVIVNLSPRPDGSPDQFYSMSPEIESERSAYYGSLDRSVDRAGESRDHFEGYMNTSRYGRMARCSTDTALRDA